jgi:small subunit ribosomal protein S21
VLRTMTREHRQRRCDRGAPYAPVRLQHVMRSPWAGRKREVVMVRVIDQQLDKALRLLKRQLSRDGTWRELKARAFYEKPSVKKRRRQRAVRRRLLKLEKMSAE